MSNDNCLVLDDVHSALGWGEGAEQTVEEREDISVVGIGLLRCAGVVNLVHVGRRDDE